MTILVTGFGPFPGVPRNPSQRLAESLPAAIAGMEVHRAILPTEYEAVAARIPALLGELRPDILLCLGVGRPGRFALETLARNHGAEDRPDQAGRIHAGPIAPDGPDTYPATLPVAEICAGPTPEGCTLERSGNAGGYVCNYSFYAACQAIAALGLATRCGFLHIPPLTEQEAEDAQLARYRETVIGVLETTVEALRA